MIFQKSATVNRMANTTIFLDYTPNSHILTGPFKDEYAKFREEYLRPALFAHYNSRLLTGPGWTIEKNALPQLEDALRRNEIVFETTNFDPEIRKIKNREKWRRAYQKRKEKLSGCQSKVDTISGPQEMVITSDVPGPQGNQNCKWQYFEFDWNDFDEQSSRYVEEQYQKGLHSCTVKCGDWKYSINFAAMTQINITHHAHTIKNVRRVPF